MQMLPSGKVGVIMRTKNRPLLLERAVQSVVNQTQDDWVLSIVNDGGEPGPVNDLIDRYAKVAKGRITVTHHENSKGMEAASNASAAACDSKFLVVHDDDDSWHPDFMAKALAVLDNPKRAVLQGIVTDTIEIIESIDGATVTEISRRAWPLDEADLTLWNICRNNLYAPIAFMYSREAYDAVGGYDEQLPVLGDWDFNLRFFARYECARIPEPLAYYHLRPSGNSTQYSNTVTHHLNIHRQYNVYLRNKLLREDIATGQPGLGFLVNMTSDMHEFRDSNGRAHEKLDSLLGQSHAMVGQLDRMNLQTNESLTILTRMNHIKNRAGAVARKMPFLKKFVGRLNGS